MKTPDFLVRTPIDVPNRSGFAMPHEVMGSGRVGTLYPVMCRPLVPNETVSLDIMFEAELPPMVSNFFGRIDLCFEAFWVPNYLLWKGWDDFMTHPTQNPVYPDGTNVASKPHNIPQYQFRLADVTVNGVTQSAEERVGKNTLFDWLGGKMRPSVGGNSVRTGLEVSSLPFLAYHRVYHDHYRNNVIQAPVFFPPSYTLPPSSYGPAAAPYSSLVIAAANVSSNDNVTDFVTNSNDFLGDGVHLYELRQANFDLDYFTAATPQPQAGGSATVTFDVAVDTETGDGSGSFSISSLRSMNAIQQWMERNNLVGYDYAEQQFVQYGRYPKRQLDKCVYLGRYSQPVYNRSVFQTGAASVVGNPFSSDGSTVGTKVGASAANGTGDICKNFVATDHGFLLVMMSLRPHVYYSSGIERHLTYKHIGDIPFPLLSTVGDQPIYNYEIAGFSSNSVDADSQIFGWIDQYAHAKTCMDSVHGELRDDGVLSPFVIQRSFDPADGVVQISDAFLEIPVDYLDQVKQVRNELVPIDYWCSVFLNFNKLSPLPLYSVPTLGRLPNTHTETVSRKKSTI